MPRMWLLLWPAVAFLVTTAIALLFRAALLRGLRGWFGSSHGVSALLSGIRLPSVLWCFVLGFFVAIDLVELPGRLAVPLRAILEAAIIVSVTVTAASVLSSLAAAASERRAITVGVTGLFRTAVRAVILSIGLLVLLDSLGIQITPLLTALGVGGLAVALALQDTLSNLFAGVHLLADRPIRVGDYVRIAESIEGHVVDVGWRSTRVKMLANNVVIVPNKKVAESIITNYDMPERRMALVLPVSVGYGSDPDRVETVLKSEAVAAAREVPGLLAEPEPLVRLIPGFGAYALEFTLICHVASFVDQYLVQHELRKRILRRLRAEGIEVPVPVRAIELRDASAAPGAGATGGAGTR
jgi:small-conductance mechanosensitive channel